MLHPDNLHLLPDLMPEEQRMRSKERPKPETVPMTDLLEPLRQRLRDMGWKQLAKFGITYWERPLDRAWLREEQAFAWLQSQENTKS